MSRGGNEGPNKSQGEEEVRMDRDAFGEHRKCQIKFQITINDEGKVVNIPETVQIIQIRYEEQRKFNPSGRRERSLALG